MSKEGLTVQNCGAGANTGMIVTKDIAGGVKKDAFFFTGELLTDADPFHCSTSAAKNLSVVTEDRLLDVKEYRTTLAIVMP